MGSLMSALPQKQTFGAHGMSAKCQKQTFAALFDHLVGGGEQRQWNGESERLRGLEIDRELEFVGLLHRQIGGVRAFENAVYILPKRRKMSAVSGPYIMRPPATTNGR